MTPPANNTSQKLPQKTQQQPHISNHTRKRKHELANSPKDSAKAILNKVNQRTQAIRIEEKPLLL